MHTSKLNKFWNQFSSFITTLWAGANCKLMQLMDLQIPCEYSTTQAIKQKKIYIQEQLNLSKQGLGT